MLTQTRAETTATLRAAADAWLDADQRWRTAEGFLRDTVAPTTRDQFVEAWRVRRFAESRLVEAFRASGRRAVVCSDGVTAVVIGADGKPRRAWGEEDTCWG